MITLRNALEALKDALPNKANWGMEQFTRLENGKLIRNFPVRQAGICLNVSDYMQLNGATSDEMYDCASLLSRLIERYCFQQGMGAYSAYPVGGSREFYDELEMDTLWDNPKRLALLDWLLEHCQ